MTDTKLTVVSEPQEPARRPRRFNPLQLVAHNPEPPARAGRPKVLTGETRRYTVVGDEETDDDLEAVRNLSRVQSTSEIFRTALQVYATLLRETRNGSTVTIISRDRRTKRDIIFA